MQEVGEFKRIFFDPKLPWTWIGTGEIGGKASGLVAVSELLSAEFARDAFPDFEISIPKFTVIRTDVFDAFVDRNGLRRLAENGSPDDVIAEEFQRASLPAEILGDLRAIIADVHSPLAVRSSSLLEDSLRQPFAGIYTTKMIPNNQPSVDARFQKLVEAIKLVYASTFFSAARDYLLASGHPAANEKMAVMIQEVVGRRFGERFYPDISAVGRSFDFYPVGRAQREDGVVSLALGLGKTIVDGDVCWTYSPRRPSAGPPFNSLEEMLERTQTRFWAVNMGKPPAYDPIRETEYLLQGNLSDAELDGSLNYLASTYDAAADRLVTGTGRAGARVLNFPGILGGKTLPLNGIIERLLTACRNAAGEPVEIELAVTLDPPRLGFLQVRPMVVSGDVIDVAPEELRGDGLLLSSDRVMGNGALESVRDVVYVRPDCFDRKNTPQIALHLEQMNRGLLEERRPYLLIGFGRWGSSDPWLGIPVNWGQVSGAKAFVEAALPNMNIELSQGSHFFHNLMSFNVCYFSVPAESFPVDWKWLATQRVVRETEHIRHVALDSPIEIRVDGRSGRGVVRKHIQSATHDG